MLVLKIWEEPQEEEYQTCYYLNSHWEQFTVITLEENHRQRDDFEYANILNRIRTGDETEEDITALRNRERPESHKDLEGATYISCTNEVVNKFNNIRINELQAEVLEVEAVSFHQTIKNFKPKVDHKKGTVGSMSFLQCLKFKVGCKVMLIHNIDTYDGLTNGAVGILIHAFKDSHGTITRLLIRFDEEWRGKEKCKKYPQIEAQYPGCVPIENIQWAYTIGKDPNRASSRATVYQFPIIVSFAATSHKFQGQEIAKPNTAALDQKTAFAEGTSYVMLSRVTSLKHMYIVGKINEKKIYPSVKALSELKRMESMSINRNPSIWDKS